MKNRILAAVGFVVTVSLLSVSRAQAGATVKSSKSNSSDREAVPPTTGTQPVRTPTVKSSKSNSSDRAVAPGVKDPTPAEATSVKSGKSNSSDRATPAGVKDPTPAEAVNLNSSKSNAYRSAGSSISGTVTKVNEKARTVTLKRTDGTLVVMDASKLVGDLPKVGRSVKCAVVNVTGKTQVVAIDAPGAPNK